MESALPARTPLNIKVLSLLLLATIVGCGEPKSVIETSDGSTMILIPAGTFPRGGTEEEVSEAPDRHILTYIAERPVSDITLTAFYLDKLEVTHAQYADFLQSAGTRDQWDHENQPDNIDHNQRHITDDMREANKPATGLNWFDAYAYCSWADKRLPSEAEWEASARGNSTFTWPWGNEFLPQHANTFGEKDGHLSVAPVASLPNGASPYGVMDMAGNVWEWVKTEKSDLRVVKGGGWTSYKNQSKISFRNAVDPKLKNPTFGFRCAANRRS